MGVRVEVNLQKEKEARARVTNGGSSGPILEMVSGIIAERGQRGVLLDVGCGAGRLRDATKGLIDRYIGADLIRYETFPADAEFHQIDADAADWGLGTLLADIVVAVETIEHIENPRAFFRSLVRRVRPGGLVVVTTPNQVSWRNKVSFLFTNQHVAFKDAPGLYPAHISPLLEEDLFRLGQECGLTGLRSHWSDYGRIPKIQWRWPAGLGLVGRRFSDNMAISGYTPQGTETPEK